MKKKLLLTYPNQHWHKVDHHTNWELQPTTLCLLAAMVDDIVDVKIVDAHHYKMSTDDFRREIEAYRPDYVGISVLTSEYGSTLGIAADIVKSVDPRIITIAGGVHVTTLPREAMTNPNVDCACHGEGEYFLREFFLWMDGKGPMPEKGLVHRSADGLQIQPRVLVDDLTTLPHPNYEYVKLEDYLNAHRRAGPNRYPELPGYQLISTRGCPFACTFCQVESIAGKKIRAMDPKHVVDHLQFLKDHYGVKGLDIVDDNVFAHKKVAKALLREMIDRDLGMKWMSSSFAIFILDDELLTLMKQAGCVGVNVAIESGNERVLNDIIRKPIKDLSLVPEKIAEIKSHGIFVNANFIIGSPSETWEEIRETIHFAEHCNADYVKFFVAVPLKGTPMYDMAIELNALHTSEDELTVQWRHSQIEGPDWTPKDVSVLRAYEWDRINFAPDRIEKTAEIWGVTINELNEIRKKTRDALELH